MPSQKLLAFALSAISSAVLISCVKPADEQDANQEINQKTTQDTTQETTQNTDNATASVGDQQDNISQLETAATTPTALTLNDSDLSAYLTHVTDDHIIPVYAEAAKQSANLHEQAVKRCQNNDNIAKTLAGDDLQALRDAWTSVAAAWARAEAVGFGVANDNMSNLYINYFPDERGLVHNSVGEFITNNPKPTAKQLGDESAIVQGIPALEDVLFAHDELNDAQCAYVISASEALATRFQKIAKAWQTEPNQYLNTTDPSVGLNQWVNGLLAYLETLKSTGIDKPLGITGNAKGHVPAVVAGQSRTIINAKLSMLSDTLTDPQLVALLADNDTVMDDISTTLADTNTLLAQMPEDIATASPNAQKQLYDHLSTLTRQIKRELMPLLGVQVGFNSTDGD